jgi:hypothetical protein
LILVQATTARAADTATAPAAPSASAPAAGDNLETHKAEMLKEIDEHIAKMQEHKSCVTAATTKEAMMACRDKMKDYRQGERTEHMDRRMERMEQRKQKMMKK